MIRNSKPFEGVFIRFIACKYLDIYRILNFVTRQMKIFVNSVHLFPDYYDYYFLYFCRCRSMFIVQLGMSKGVARLRG